MSQARVVRAPRGPERTAQTWGAEGALRMLHNNLDPEVAERPEDLVVYGGAGRAAPDPRRLGRPGSSCGGVATLARARGAAPPEGARRHVARAERQAGRCPPHPRV